MLFFENTITHSSYKPFYNVFTELTWNFDKLSSTFFSPKFIIRSLCDNKTNNF